MSVTVYSIVPDNLHYTKQFATLRKRQLLIASQATHPHNFFCFFFVQDMIHIADTKVERRYGDFFIRQIHKFEEVGQPLSRTHSGGHSGVP